eukprot:COSAG02_NODE_9412_length_2225_cov_1.084666_1_plen_75_part_10
MFHYSGIREYSSSCKYMYVASDLFMQPLATHKLQTRSIHSARFSASIIIAMEFLSIEKTYRDGLHCLKGHRRKPE